MSNFFPNNPKYSIKEFLSDYVEELSSSMNDLDLNSLESVYQVLLDAVKKDSVIYTCGNGGSAAIAEHFVCDFVKGASTDSSIDPKVVPLLNTPTITAIGNDIGYEDIFSYQVEKYGTEGDVLMCVSSSGNSKNIIKAIQSAKIKNMTSLSFVGFDGGKAKSLSDHAVHVESNNYGICEDAHHSLMHIFAQFLRLKNINDTNILGNIKF